jgi:uncharacterized UPF0160 family protein
MLKQTKEFQGATLVRTRDAAKLEECDIVVDVGGVYDPAKHRYDHHQVEEKDGLYTCQSIDTFLYSVDLQRHFLMNIKQS